MHGRAPLLQAVAGQDTPSSRSLSGQSLDLVYQLAWLILLALVGAGFPLRRSDTAALARLGVKPLRLGEVPVLLGLSGAVVVLGLGTLWATDSLWAWAGWARTDGVLVRRLFGAPITSPLGIVVLALSAGVGEELIARGLLQPRLGWMLPNIAFAAAHALQYGTDGVLVVFVVGAAEAFIRARRNTTAAAFVHATYDATLLLLSLLGTNGT